MISIEDISKLHTADELRTVADSALGGLLEGAIARVINLAANTGEYTATWTGILDESLLSKLATNNIVAEPVSGSATYGSKNPTVWKFSWEDTDDDN